MDNLISQKNMQVQPPKPINTPIMSSEQSLLLFRPCPCFKNFDHHYNFQQILQKIFLFSITVFILLPITIISFMVFVCKTRFWKIYQFHFTYLFLKINCVFVLVFTTNVFNKRYSQLWLLKNAVLKDLNFWIYTYIYIFVF